MEKAQFGSFVAENRKSLGLTQKDLAEKLHVTDKAVSKWERGLSYPDVTLLEPLGKVFGLGVTELVACRRESGREAQEVRSLLEISGENVRRERTRRIHWTVVLGILLLAALTALGVLISRGTVRETGSLSILYREEQGNDLLLYTEKEGHLLRLSYAGADRDDLILRLEDGYELQGDYRWDRRSYKHPHRDSQGRGGLRHGPVRIRRRCPVRVSPGVGEAPVPAAEPLGKGVSLHLHVL